MNSLFTTLILILFAFFTFSDALKPAAQHRSRRSNKKSHKHGGHHKQQQLYGVSLSSITGFEKPMIPPNIINFDIPINYERPPVNQDLFTLDLPTKLDFLANNNTNSITEISTAPLNLQQ